MIYTMDDIAEIVKQRTDGQGILFPADVREMLLDMRHTYVSELKAARATIDVLRNEESALTAHKDAEIARLTDALNEAHAKAEYYRQQRQDADGHSILDAFGVDSIEELWQEQD